MDEIHRAGLVKEGDTLLGFREMSGLTLDAFASEMGMPSHHYKMLELGNWKVKHWHLKFALTIVRLAYLRAGI